MTCVNGHKPSPEELDRMIDSGEAEAIFKKAILEPGRGSVSSSGVSGRV